MLTLLSVVDCGQPPVVSGGQVTVTATTFQLIATYECNRAFEFLSGGSSSVECQADRTWSIPIPPCQREYRGHSCGVKLHSTIA